MKFLQLFEDARIAQVIQNLVGEFRRGGDCKTPREINSGYCDLFAERLEQELRAIGIHIDDLHQEESDEETGEGVDHAWVEIGGRHYDAECPHGTPTRGGLPCFRRLKIT